MVDTALTDVMVVELGERIGVGLCGSFLSQLGATVILVEHPTGEEPRGKWRHRPLFAAGKLSVEVATDDGDRLRRIIGAADVVLTSSDVDHDSIANIFGELGPAAIVCDITAFGASGPLGGKPYSDPMVQATAGLMAVTGFPDGPPVATRMPVLENSTGLYATAAIIAALRARRQTGHGQRIDMALYDCAINFLTTFLPGHYAGKPAGRLGNGHAMVTPWNAYATKDGWVLICSVTDTQWQRLCHVIGRPDLAEDKSFATLADRIGHREEVDDAVAAWTAGRTIDECADALNRVNTASGGILCLADIRDEPNLMHRNMVRAFHDPVSGREWLLPGTPIRADTWETHTPHRIPARNEDEEMVDALIAACRTDTSDVAREVDAKPPLAGIRVLEIGQFTTAPLAGKILASLGAEVLKIEPPGGDAARDWAPHANGLSYFFVFSNSDKRSLEIDLRSDRGRAAFRALIRSADVLVENMKPGSLARLGLPVSELKVLNPDLVYCAVSGFGADSVYEARPAFDTVVQAMCGIMDMTRDRDTPLKCGASICDVSGGQLALIAILAALEYRDRTGRGTCLDLSMQDIGAYLTQTGWNTGTEATGAGTILKASDGHVYVDSGDNEETASFKENGRAGLNREAVVGYLTGRGLAAVPVLTISEVAEHAQIQARHLVFESAGPKGPTWPLLGSPLRLMGTPPLVRHAIGKPEPLSQRLLSELGLMEVADDWT